MGIASLFSKLNNKFVQKFTLNQLFIFAQSLLKSDIRCRCFSVDFVDIKNTPDEQLY